MSQLLAGPKRAVLHHMKVGDRSAWTLKMHDSMDGVLCRHFSCHDRLPRLCLHGTCHPSCRGKMPYPWLEEILGVKDWSVGAAAMLPGVDCLLQLQCQPFPHLRLAEGLAHPRRSRGRVLTPLENPDGLLPACVLFLLGSTHTSRGLLAGSFWLLHWFQPSGCEIQDVLLCPEQGGW